MAFLLVLALAVVNCSKDDDTPTTYDFEDQFEDLEELPGVEDEDPEITEPDTGKVQESAATANVMADLGDGSGDVSAETQASLDAVENFGASLSTDAQAEAQSLDATRAEEILNMTDLDGELAGLEASLDNAPAEILELLPSVDFGADLGTSSVFNEDLFRSGLGAKEVATTNQQTGPCFEAAKKAYDEAMAPAIAKRQENLEIIDANYQRRLGEAETRAASRQAAVDAARDDYAAYILDTTVALLDLAASVESTNAAFAANLRTYALLFLVEGSSSLTAWYIAASQKVADKKVAEKTTATSIKTTKTTEVETKFAAIKATADAKLADANRNCHNQGSGS
ncbi:hypothetical protein [Christiangramia echinicola]|nr:hypothetical protein [Christiangramia echinicola]